MTDIDTLVIGVTEDFYSFQDDPGGRDGVVFALVPGGSRIGKGGGGDGDGVEYEPLRDAIERHQPRRALVLSPYRGMSVDIARLMEHGVDVRTAGPLPGGFQDTMPPILEMHRSDPGFTKVLEASRHVDFGDPVYLRMVSSPYGGKWHRWWCAFQISRKATALLDAPLRRIYVAATGKAQRTHVSITLKTMGESTGHLLVAPSGSGLQDDLFLLGTGGTLSDDPLLNQPGMYGQSDYRMLPRQARRSLADLWREDAAIALTADEHRFYLDLLRAIGNSSRSGSGICLEYPMA